MKLSPRKSICILLMLCLGAFFSCYLLFVLKGWRQRSFLTRLHEDWGVRVAADDEIAEKPLSLALDYAGSCTLTDPRYCESIAESAPVRRVMLRGRNGQVPESIRKCLFRMQTIHDLYIRDVALTDEDIEAIARLPNLTCLTLSHTSLTEARLKSLATLERLEEMHLEVPYLSENGLHHLVNLKSLTRLSIANADMDDSAFASLASLSISSLELHHCRFSDAALTHLKDNPRLKTLSLASSRVTDAGLSNLGAMPKLRRLNLSRTFVTDVGLAEIERLHALEELDVSYTEVTDNGLARLNRIDQLKSVTAERDPRD